MSAIALARHVLDAYDGVAGAQQALEALLPHAEMGSGPALFVASVLSAAGCVQERFVPVEVAPVAVTASQSHAGAVGAALYQCIEQEKNNELIRDSYQPVWGQIKTARGEVGDHATCVTAAALLACNSGDMWYGVDHYLEAHNETCAGLIVAADRSRAERDR